MSIENVTKFEFLETTITDENYIHREVTRLKYRKL